MTRGRGKKKEEKERKRKGYQNGRREERSFKKNREKREVVRRMREE
jgi:hypothetical protein